MSSANDPAVPAAVPLAGPLLQAVRRLLRPLVRLLIHQGVTWPVLTEMLRGLYVEVALEILPGERARTDSRISLLTGVHRKEIRRLRLLEADRTDVVPPVVTVSSQIVARWLAMPGYQDAEGRPIALPRTPVDHGPSFDGLVEAVTTDVRPRAVLDSWLADGMVTVDAQDRLHLNTAAFVPRAGSEAQLFYFARNLQDHLAAASANVAADGPPPFVDRSVHYDRLTDAQAQRLEAAARAAAIHAVLQVNQLALTLLDTDPTEPPVVGKRINFGVYIYKEDETP